MDAERQRIVDELKILVDENYDAPLVERIGKSSEISANLRIEGNNLYRLSRHTAKQHQALLNAYSKSVAWAPMDSEELALAYSNRSVALFHIKKYKECMEDIDKALEISNSDYLKVKLYCRKVQCLTALGMANGKETFAKANKCFGKIDESDTNRKSLDKLIQEAKKTLDANKAVRKEYDNKESKEILAKRERQDLFNFVEMKYSKKDGRHLVAARDYKPGDIIFVEKPFAVYPNDTDNSFMYCAHCLSLTLASVPCDFCTWCVYCTEQCKKEAWEKFHELECPIIPHVAEPKSNSMCLKLALRIFIMMIKQVGSLEKLKAELKNIDTDEERYKRCYSTTRLDNLVKVIFTLSSNMSNEYLSNVSQDLTKSLISIVQFPPFFGQGDFVNLKLKDLAKNDDFLFIGSLLLKLMKITNSNKFYVNNFLFKTKENKLSFMDQDEIDAHYTTFKGISLQLIGSFFNNCCCSAANAEKFYTEDSKLVIYAVEPIKKNSQIFIDYFGTYHQNEGFNVPKIELKRRYGFDCNCIGCNEGWPDTSPSSISIETGSTVPGRLVRKFHMLRDQIDVMYKGKELRKTMSQIKGDVESAFKLFEPPSPHLSFIKNTVAVIYIQEYGQSERAFAACD